MGRREEPVEVTVLGAGRMGIEIGAEYALLPQCQVTYLVRDPTTVRGRLDDLWVDIGRLGLHADEEIEAAAGRTEVAHVESQHANSQVIVESLPEDLELKIEVLSAVLPSHPEAIVATNTSSLSIEAIGRAVGAAHRTIGAHYLYPPLLMPLVEVIPGPETESSVVERITNLLEQANKNVIIVRKPKPGFVWNRLQFALLREAVDLVESGVVSAADIDVIMSQGLGRRWRSMGPLAAAHAGGADTFVRAARGILPALSTRVEIDSLWSVDVDVPPPESIQSHFERLAEDIKRSATTGRSNDP